ncbi:MAG: MarR family winged helix-turn-helix transcriptional regulator [Bacteroidota bacterium]|jgi:DNA-binding MarR family transcriptional regulator
MAESVFNPELAGTAGKTVAALERISEAFRVLLWEENRRNGLSPVQNQIIIFLLHHSGALCSVSALAAEFNMSKPTMSDAIKVLEQKEFIKREIADDARSFRILLTAKGRQLAKKTELFAAPIAAPVAAMPAKQQEQLFDSLLQVIAALQKGGIIQQQRMCLSCRNYRSEKNGQFYCTLLQQKLTTADLRIDCPEHELSEIITL